MFSLDSDHPPHNINFCGCFHLSFPDCPFSYIYAVAFLRSKISFSPSIQSTLLFNKQLSLCCLCGLTDFVGFTVLHGNVKGHIHFFLVELWHRPNSSLTTGICTQNYVKEIFVKKTDRFILICGQGQ